ncbi:fluoride efflux transporter CrcB [Bacillus sp. Bva_UNVM-123]|uniref:fluoride efflux transporter CrcB n=1 Tax=Bacillus sp. Bva_UNVM-123 TaxID=2829798 RepID=UPI00391F3A6A
MIHILFVVIGGFFGAVCRYSCTKLFNAKYTSKFPIATFIVNVLGSFVLGFVLGNVENSNVHLFVGTGFLGAFTTFSTFNLEAIQLFERKEKILAIMYICLTYLSGIIFAFSGFLLGKM